MLLRFETKTFTAEYKVSSKRVLFLGNITEVVFSCGSWQCLKQLWNCLCSDEFVLLAVTLFMSQLVPHILDIAGLHGPMVRTPLKRTDWSPHIKLTFISAVGIWPYSTDHWNITIILICQVLIRCDGWKSVCTSTGLQPVMSHDL